MNLKEYITKEFGIVPDDFQLNEIKVLALNPIQEELERRLGIIQGETDEFTKSYMVSILTDSL